MRKLLAACGLASLIGLAGCATATGYGPAQPAGYGFEETRIEQNRFQVTFAGNSLTDLQTVQTYLLYRSAELTSQNGYDYFVIVDRNLDEDTRFQSTGFAPPPPFMYQYYSPRWGWRYHYDPFYRDVDLREVTRYRAIAEIIMGTGPKPADPKAYNAEEVLINLAPSIQRGIPQ